MHCRALNLTLHGSSFATTACDGVASESSPPLRLRNTMQSCSPTFPAAAAAAAAAEAAAAKLGASDGAWRVPNCSAQLPPLPLGVRLFQIHYNFVWCEHCIPAVDNKQTGTGP
jgi:hypothetical protein